VQPDVGQPHHPREKTGDVQDAEPDCDGEQERIDLAERPVEATSFL
jgi:hypothetical protein